MYHQENSMEAGWGGGGGVAASIDGVGCRLCTTAGGCSHLRSSLGCHHDKLSVGFQSAATACCTSFAQCGVLQVVFTCQQYVFYSAPLSVEEDL